MDRDVSRVLITREQIAQRVRTLGAEISTVYADSSRGLTILPVLSGAIIFLADLIRELPLKMKIAVVHLSSYRGTATDPGEMRVIHGVSGDIRDRDVLIVDDILDTGNTLRRVHGLVRGAGPASMRTAVLLRKPSKAPADLAVDFVGFDVEDQFVVGYGLDYDDHYRNYPDIAVLRPELLK